VKIKILSSASDDLIDGYDFYEKQSEGVGEYFIDSLFSDIDSLVLNAGIHPTYLKTYYRMLSKRFPFAIYYKIYSRTVIIYAVLDCRRKPAWIRNRLT